MSCLAEYNVPWAQQPALPQREPLKVDVTQLGNESLRRSLNRLWLREADLKGKLSRQETQRRGGQEELCLKSWPGHRICEGGK